MQKNSPLSHHISIIVLICLLGFSSALTAKMYKWVDAKGNTHYTQSPPPDGVEGETITPPGKVDVEAAQKSLDQQRNKADSYAQERKEQSEEKAKQKAEMERKNKNCEISRSNVAKLERPRVTDEDDQGELYSVPEEERLERLKKAREQVKEHCN
ncbi:MAG: hypothetical protein DHS20C13_30340 [Thermodesulfobacteriota bacterium]|nr:MAG: hypothetical protein DHS20C13_30340 [Thermodesulfobacteriota bacterium]